MKKTYRLIIVGAGASGMTAAMAAVKKGLSGEEILLLEAQDRIGRKLLVTGNGRCNLTNLSFSASMDKDQYRSDNRELLPGYLERFGALDTVSMFREMGLFLTERMDGYLYPRSMQAASVLDAFCFRLGEQGVSILTKTRVVSVQKGRKGLFRVDTVTDVENREDSFYASRLIIACGTPAGQKKGEGLDGYRIAEILGHRVTDIVPALCGVRCKGSIFKIFAGVRCDAALALSTASGTYTERGELQLTEYGLSGIPMFQLSRYAARELLIKDRVFTEVDFLPEISDEELETIAEKRLMASQEGKALEQVFHGLINKKLLQGLLKLQGLRPEDAYHAGARKTAQKIFYGMKHFRTEIYEVNQFPNAQVCAGGVALCEVDENLQSRLVSGLYFTGELLDVDGICGGYNLQWAWTSGSIAGTHAAQELIDT